MFLSIVWCILLACLSVCFKVAYRVSSGWPQTHYITTANHPPVRPSRHLLQGAGIRSKSQPSGFAYEYVLDLMKLSESPEKTQSM